MKKLGKLLVSFLSIISLNNCSTFQISDIGPMVQLPYSKNCFQVFILSGREVEYPPEKCEDIKKRGVILTSKMWKLLRRDIQNNCQFAKCEQLRSTIDALFLAIDDGFNKVLWYNETKDMIIYHDKELYTLP